MTDSNAQRAVDQIEYLQLLARMQVAPHLKGKVDVSGVVQQTIWEAAKASQPIGDDRVWMAWLKRLLANNLRDEIRKVSAAKRDVRREKSIDAAFDASSARIESWLAAQQESPSQKVQRIDELNQLAVALTAMPEDQRVAIELYHLQGLPLAEVADHLQRSKPATASLLYRGLKELKTRLASNAGDH